MKKIFLSKNTIQQNCCIYLIINCAFLLPVLLITQRVTEPIIVPIVNFLGLFFLIYWLPVIFYYLFGLPYLHIALSLGFLGFCIYKLVKEKNWKRFFLILFLTIVSIALNLYWLTHGRSYTIV